MRLPRIHWLVVSVAIAMSLANAAEASGGISRKPVAGPRLSGFIYPQSESAVYVLGTNSSRQLGPSVAATALNSAAYNPLFPQGFIRSMAFGNNHGLIALDDGSVQMWGGVDSYTLSSPGAANPDLRVAAYSLFRSARQVAAGSTSSYVLLQGGTLYAFGFNNSGQLGNGTIGAGSSIPRPVSGLGNNIVFVDSKCDTAAAIDDLGRLWTWGNNASGQLGIGAAGGANGTPTVVLGEVTQVAVGCDFIIALQKTGQVTGWGANGSGQLGQNNTVPRTSPTLIPVQNVVSIAAGYNHAHAITIDGRVLAWGRNSEGQLGLNAFSASQLSPAFVPGVTTAVSVTGGDYHTLLAVQNKGYDLDVLATGYNDNGQIGVSVALGASSASFIPFLNGSGIPTTMRRTGIRNGFGQDLVWYNSSTGENGYWAANGVPSSTYTQLRVVNPGWSVFGTGDMNFDDLTEIFFYNPGTGEVYFWSTESIYAAPGMPVLIFDEGLIGRVDPLTGWRPQHVGDMDGDGVADIVWRNISTGAVAIWYLTADGRVGFNAEFGAVPLEWRIVKTGDFDGNGVDDILWHNTSTGQVNVWFKSIGHNQVLDLSVGSAPPVWVPQVVMDLDGDGRSDIFWRNTSTGQTFVWYMMGNTHYDAAGPSVPNLQWNAVASFAGFNDAQQSGIVWRNGSTGEVYYWRVNDRPTGSTFAVTGEGTLGVVPLSWQIGQ